MDPAGLSPAPAGAEALFAVYRRAPVAFVRGQGAWLWDEDGRPYLDFVAGIATCALGHAHPRLVAALQAQAARLVHVSNLFRIREQEAAAARLVARSGLERVFFANSGAEANEAAIKLARRWGVRTKGPQATTIVAAEGGFHGRTLGALAATGKPAIQRDFGPLPPGFRHVPWGDVAALETAVDDTVCAVLLEPVQGEAGVRLPPPGYLEAAAAVCRDRGALLMLDEVQTGVGRTGAWFAFQHYGLTPDVLTLGKGVAGGVPIGAVLARDEVAAVLGPGDHGSTFGGNPLACAAAVAVLDTIDAEELLDAATARGAELVAGLEQVRARTGLVEDVRAAGLLVGVDVAVPGAAVTEAARARGLLVNAVGDRTLRLAPPLVVRAAEVADALARLEAALQAAADLAEVAR